MKKRKRMRSSYAMFAAVTFVMLSAASAFADENAWIYDTSARREIVPASSAVMIPGLDAMARGLGDAVPETVDKWFWTWMYSNEYRVFFGPTGMSILIR